MGRPGWGACFFCQRPARVSLLISLLQPAIRLDEDWNWDYEQERAAEKTRLRRQFRFCRFLPFAPGHSAPILR
jgi:hypothetical protein